MSMPPTVSIIVPCYDCRETIRETIDSVLAQTFTDWECILVSDDGTSYLDFLTERGLVDRRLVEHPERTQASGTVQPRNRGFPLVRGAYVADLDGDDIWKPTRLERLLPEAERHGCAQDILECFDASGVLGYSGAPGSAGETLNVEAVLSFDFPFHLVVRRDRAGALWSPHDTWVPDVVRTMRFAAQGPVFWLREALLQYRVSGASMSQSLAGARRIDEAYGDALRQLEHGDGFGLTGSNRAAATAGFRRKRKLNRCYMDAVAGDPEPMPFIEWILANGHSGVGRGASV